jgi:hypothetical protein
MARIAMKTKRYGPEAFEGLRRGLEARSTNRRVQTAKASQTIRESSALQGRENGLIRLGCKLAKERLDVRTDQALVWHIGSSGPDAFRTVG